MISLLLTILAFGLYAYLSTKLSNKFSYNSVSANSNKLSNFNFAVGIDRPDANVISEGKNSIESSTQLIINGLINLINRTKTEMENHPTDSAEYKKLQTDLFRLDKQLADYKNRNNL